MDIPINLNDVVKWGVYHEINRQYPGLADRDYPRFSRLVDNRYQEVREERLKAFQRVKRSDWLDDYLRGRMMHYAGICSELTGFREKRAITEKVSSILRICDCCDYGLVRELFQVYIDERRRLRSSGK
ncbi:hypothetical protein GF386_03965 [Candidatus Pacearchaeota archaeon]|nr:hypothetical protein [Candidatus Pacearchaeota archaeon]MBD3283305.1 hypothetical protein [Candidatus Pacearchaeota archaeon]